MSKNAKATAAKQGAAAKKVYTAKYQGAYDKAYKNAYNSAYAAAKKAGYAKEFRAAYDKTYKTKYATFHATYRGETITVTLKYQNRSIPSSHGVVRSLGGRCAL